MLLQHGGVKGVGLEIEKCWCVVVGIVRGTGYAEEEGSTLMLLEGEIGVEVGGSELGGDRHEGAGTA